MNFFLVEVSVGFDQVLVFIFFCFGYIYELGYFGKFNLGLFDWIIKFDY